MSIKHLKYGSKRGIREAVGTLVLYYILKFSSVAGEDSFLISIVGFLVSLLLLLLVVTTVKW